jgi:hypothetical protein
MMAFKWTKASRAKLSRSQKARWKERKRQQSRKRLSVPPANKTGIWSVLGLEPLQAQVLV